MNRGSAPRLLPTLEIRLEFGSVSGVESTITHRKSPRVCPATDCLADGSTRPDLERFGFDTVDLSGLDVLQETCVAVRLDGRITDAQARAIRAALDGAVLPTVGGATLRVLHLAEEGFIMRTSGPNDMALVSPDRKSVV